MFWRISKTKNPVKELNELKTEIQDINTKLLKMETRMERLEKFLKRTDYVPRVGVFVDVQNLFYGAKKLYDSRIDYVKLLKFMVKARRLVVAHAYIIENPDIDQENFISLLEHHSFTVRSKRLIQRADGTQKGDWDVGIVLDMIRLADKLDVVALASGDGDFVEIVEYIKTLGPIVEVYGFPQNTAIQIKEAADEFFPLGYEVLLTR